MNNTGLLVDTRSTAGVGWTIGERGFTYTIERPGAFKLAFRSREADPLGWKLEEANAIRARLTSLGAPRSRIIYASGREYIDGRFRALDAAAADMLAMQDASPGRITVLQDTGRAERNTSGDANNDGYAESTGTYQLLANGPRMELEMTPGGGGLTNPVLEIAGLPAGGIVASIEGKLIERTARLDNGRVLIELPGRIDRPVGVSVRVRQD
jgi:hypothetical protein